MAEKLPVTIILNCCFTVVFFTNSISVRRELFAAALSQSDKNSKALETPVDEAKLVSNSTNDDELELEDVDDESGGSGARALDSQP